MGRSAKGALFSVCVHLTFGGDNGWLAWSRSEGRFWSRSSRAALGIFLPAVRGLVDDSGMFLCWIARSEPAYREADQRCRRIQWSAVGKAILLSGVPSPAPLAVGREYRLSANRDLELVPVHLI